MLHHRTTDPAQRAAHIADRLEREHDEQLIERGEPIYLDYPRYWLDAYAEVIREIEDEIN